MTLKTDYNRAEIIEMLSAEGTAMQDLFIRSAEVKNRVVGDKLYRRGLIEYSNICMKNCLYCGIRRGNHVLQRYTLTDEEVMQAVEYAYDNGFGSVVLQAGENTSPNYVDTIERLLNNIRIRYGEQLGITLSLGEQSEDTYKRWFEAGAHRYLLRIETSSRDLYREIHPQDDLHNYDKRLRALETLREVGYQVGTGVMIGLPGQTTEDLADDILFMRGMDIDMCGMGPYIESAGTPLWAETAETGGAVDATDVAGGARAAWANDEAVARLSGAENFLLPPKTRLDMALKMVATLRIVMPDINIASTTALSSLSDDGRFLAVKYGANVIMPNITPSYRQGNYQLYDGKSSELDKRFESFNIARNERGDSLHFRKK